MGRFCSGAALRMRGSKPVIAFGVVLFKTKASFFKIHFSVHNNGKKTTQTP